MSISAMCALFQMGSSIRLASRVPRMFCTVVMARKWSTRKTAASCTSSASSRLSSTALSRSSPNGFSRTILLPGGRPARAERRPRRGKQPAAARGRRRPGRHRRGPLRRWVGRRHLPVIARCRHDRLPGRGGKPAAVTIEPGGRPVPEVLGIPLLATDTDQLESVAEVATRLQRGKAGQQVARRQVACSPEDGQPLDHGDAPACSYGCLWRQAPWPESRRWR